MYISRCCWVFLKNFLFACIEVREKNFVGLCLTMYFIRFFYLCVKTFFFRLFQVSFFGLDARFIKFCFLNFVSTAKNLILLDLTIF